MLLAEDYSNAQIARRLVISQHTVKVHLRHIFEKLEVQSRLGVVLLALRRGWLALAWLALSKPYSHHRAVTIKPLLLNVRRIDREYHAYSKSGYP